MEIDGRDLHLLPYPKFPQVFIVNKGDEFTVIGISLLSNDLCQCLISTEGLIGLLSANEYAAHRGAYSVDAIVYPYR